MHMRMLREWGFPVAILVAWWFGFVWALTIWIGPPAPKPEVEKPARPPVAAKVEPRRS
jgi:hypothetical protein